MHKLFQFETIVVSFTPLMTFIYKVFKTPDHNGFYHMFLNNLHNFSLFFFILKFSEINELRNLLCSVKFYDYEFMHVKSVQINCKVINFKMAASGEKTTIFIYQFRVNC